MMFNRIGLTVAALAVAVMTMSSANAQQYTDMRGVWSGSYVAVSPSRENSPGPRFNKAQIMIDIQKQTENALYGVSKWRVEGRDEWRSHELTGSVSVGDPNAVSMLEKSPTVATGIAGLIDGRLKDGKLYISFRGFRRGTAYSAVLEKAP